MSFISKTALFRGCSEEDILNMAEHLNFRTDRYGNGAVIFGAGSIVTDIGLVLAGSVRIEHTDLWGNKSILGITPAGGVFAWLLYTSPSPRDKRQGRMASVG